MTKFHKKEIERFKQEIDKMNQEEMAKIFRFSKDGHPYFRLDYPNLIKYFNDRFERLGGMTKKISEKIGWG